MVHLIRFLYYLCSDHNLYIIIYIYIHVCLFVVACFPGITTHCGRIFRSPVAGFSLLVFEVSWSCTMTRHSRWDSSGRVINPSQRPLPDNTQHSQQTNIHAPGGIQITISAGKRLKTYALHRAATGTGIYIYVCLLLFVFLALQRIVVVFFTAW